METSKRTWRPFGFWALTINASFGFPVLVIGVFLRPEAPWSVLAGSYASVLMAWCMAAGIRQWGKNEGVESYDTEG